MAIKWPDNLISEAKFCREKVTFRGDQVLYESNGPFLSNHFEDYVIAIFHWGSPVGHVPIQSVRHILSKVLSLSHPIGQFQLAGNPILTRIQMIRWLFWFLKINQSGVSFWTANQNEDLKTDLILLFEHQAVQYPFQSSRDEKLFLYQCSDKIQNLTPNDLYPPILTLSHSTLISFMG